MINEKNIVRLYGVLLAIFAPPATLMIYGIWRNMSAWLIAFTLIALRSFFIV